MKNDLYIKIVCLIFLPISSAFGDEINLDAALKLINQLKAENKSLMKKNQKLENFYSLHAEKIKSYNKLNSLASNSNKAINSKSQDNSEKDIIHYSNFEGMYIGINGGYGGGEFIQNNFELLNQKGNNGLDITNNAFVNHSSDKNRMGGASAGIQLGYNFQSWNRFIISGETDFQWSDISKTAYGDNQTYLSNTTGQFSLSGPLFSANNSRVGLRWFGTTRLRIGYDIGNLMPYFTGGLAYGISQNQYSTGLIQSFQTTNQFSSNKQSFGQNVLGDSKTISVGWSAGAGLEYKISNNVSLKSEYLFTHYGSPGAKLYGVGRTISNVESYNTLSYTNNLSQPFNVHQIRIGVNYHLNLFQIYPKM